jgi:putative toxin-antitoxin system antitoxin component (TIGR02293 family)
LTKQAEPQRMQQAIASRSILGSDLRAVRANLGLTVDDVAKVLGVGSRTVTRKEQAKSALSVTEGDRAYRLARVADLAIDMIGDGGKAKNWLQRPNAYLGEKPPVQMLETEIGTDRVMESLYAIGYGGVA